jgi:hypothetical protein
VKHRPAIWTRIKRLLGSGRPPQRQAKKGTAWPRPCSGPIGTGAPIRCVFRSGTVSSALRPNHRIPMPPPDGLAEQNGSSIGATMAPIQGLSLPASTKPFLDRIVPLLRGSFLLPDASIMRPTPAGGHAERNERKLLDGPCSDLRTPISLRTEIALCAASRAWCCQSEFKHTTGCRTAPHLLHQHQTNPLADTVCLMALLVANKTGCPRAQLSAPLDVMCALEHVHIAL